MRQPFLVAESSFFAHFFRVTFAAETNNSGRNRIRTQVNF